MTKLLSFDESCDLLVQSLTTATKDDPTKGIKSYLNLYTRTSPEVWFKLVRFGWQHASYHSLFADELNQIFVDNRESWIFTMSDGELTKLKTLPDKFTVYRGCSEINKNGLSWTTSKIAAISYPSMPKTKANGKPILITATANKKDVVMLKNTKFKEKKESLPYCVNDEIVLVNVKDMSKTITPLSLAQCHDARFNSYLWSSIDKQFNDLQRMIKF